MRPAAKTLYFIAPALLWAGAISPVFAATDPYATADCTISAVSSSDPTHATCTFNAGATTALDETAADGSTYAQFDNFTPSGIACDDVDDDLCPETEGDAANFCNGYATDRDVYVRLIETGVGDVLPIGAEGPPGELVDTVVCADLCGNGIIDGTEDCDVGPGNPSDGCIDPTEENECTFQGGGSPSGDWTLNDPVDFSDMIAIGGWLAAFAVFASVGLWPRRI